MKNNRKSSLLAVAFFAVMTFVASYVAQAQEDTTYAHQLLNTTGTGVLDDGRLMLSADASVYGLHYSGADRGTSYNAFGTAVGLRWGIGSRAELTLNVSEVSTLGKVAGIEIPEDNFTVVPSVGVRLQLVDDGLRWPSVTFYTQLTMPIRQGQIADNYNGSVVEPILGLQLRHKLWQNVWLDASLGYAWNRFEPYFRGIDDPIRYGVWVRWLNSDRHMTSFGFSNRQGNIEYLWQTNDRLQLKAGVSLAAGIGKDGGALEYYGSVGLNWYVNSKRTAAVRSGRK